jgi:hypothetical protein
MPLRRARPIPTLRALKRIGRLARGLASNPNVFLCTKVEKEL